MSNANTSPSRRVITINNSKLPETQATLDDSVYKALIPAPYPILSHTLDTHGSSIVMNHTDTRYDAAYQAAAD